MTTIDELIKHCVDNPDKTVEDIMNEFHLTRDVSWYIIREASKKLK